MTYLWWSRGAELESLLALTLHAATRMVAHRLGAASESPTPPHLDDSGPTDCDDRDPPLNVTLNNPKPERDYSENCPPPSHLGSSSQSLENTLSQRFSVFPSLFLLKSTEYRPLKRLRYSILPHTYSVFRVGSHRTSHRTYLNTSRGGACGAVQMIPSSGCLSHLCAPTLSYKL